MYRKGYNKNARPYSIGPGKHEFASLLLASWIT
jgi:hypothetical protein